MGRKPKYSKEVKIKACEDYEKGYGSFYGIAKIIGTEKSVVRRWYLTYKEHRPSAFETSDNNRSYSKEFKLSVIEKYTLSNYSIVDLAAKHNIFLGVIYNWINKWYKGINVNIFLYKSANIFMYN